MPTKKFGLGSVAEPDSCLFKYKLKYFCGKYGQIKNKSATFVPWNVARAAKQSRYK